MNQSDYFPHHCDARNDDKILRARMELGSAEGYAIPFMLYERLCAKEGHKEEANYSTLAFDLRVDKKLIQRVIEEFGLFQTELGEDGKTYFYFSEGLSERLAPLDEKRMKRKAAGRKGGETKALRAADGSKSASLLQKKLSKNDVLLQENGSKSANLLTENCSRVEESKRKKNNNKQVVVEKESAVCYGTNNTTTTTNFEEKNNWSAKLTDKEYLEMAEELLIRFSSTPSHEIEGIVDLCHPEWNGQYGNFINNKADVIGKLWKIPDERKYRRSHGANKIERELARVWIDMVRKMESFDPVLIDCYRGMVTRIDAEDKDVLHVTLYVRSMSDIQYLEDKYLIPLSHELRYRFGQKTKLSYSIK